MEKKLPSFTQQICIQATLDPEANSDANDKVATANVNATQKAEGMKWSFTWHNGSTKCVWSTPPLRPGGGPRTGRGSRVALAAGSLGPCRSKTCSLLSLLPGLSPEKLAFYLTQ